MLGLYKKDAHPNSKKMADQQSRFTEITSTLLNMFDASKTGSLNKVEFQALMDHVSKLQGMPKTPEVYVANYFDCADRNNDQKITLEEFQVFLKDNCRPIFNLNCWPMCAEEESYNELKKMFGL